MLADGRFRKDLFYRLNVIPLHIPPLRERRADILTLTRHFLSQIAQEAALIEIEMDAESENALTLYNWPGNVRELSNVLERVLSTLEGNTIQLNDLPFYIYRSQRDLPHTSQTSLKEVQARTEREAIRFALKESGYNKAKAAKLLGIHRTLLYKKMKKYGLSLDPDTPS
jgi:DNA-binding NtrC family response regulator